MQARKNYFFLALFPDFYLHKSNLFSSKVGQPFLHGLLRKWKPCFSVIKTQNQKTIFLQVRPTPTVIYPNLMKFLCLSLAMEYDLSFPVQNQVGFKWALNDLVIFNNGRVTWNLDHSITAHKPRYLLNRFRPATATTTLFQELIWIIHGKFKNYDRTNGFLQTCQFSSSALQNMIARA